MAIATSHEQFCGRQLEEIYRHAGAASDAVVSWCPWCGAVVVDEEYDGRVNPGKYGRMRFPIVTARAIRTST